MGEMEQMKQEAEQLKKQIAVNAGNSHETAESVSPPHCMPKPFSSTTSWSWAFSTYILGSLCSSPQPFKC